MRVESICVSNNAGKQQKFEPTELHEALEHIGYGDLYSRVAFVGRMPAGRAGFALEIYEGAITGHKMDPVPAELLSRVAHFRLWEAREGFKALCHGNDVLIGKEKSCILLRWNAFLEVFGTGIDSMAPL